MEDDAGQWAKHRWDLDRGAVHVWAVPLDGPSAPLVGLLSAAERQRAERFHFAFHRRRYIIAHSRLRWLLGRYRDCPPEAIRFTHGPHGKPDLAERGLSFNLSHSHDLALVAVRRSGRVGVDVERLRPMPDAEQMAQRFFAAGEIERLKAVAPDDYMRAFFTCWVRKEAYIKATGEGLSFPLDRFEVTLAADEPAALLHIADDVVAAQAWTMHALTPMPEYLAALVVDGPLSADQIVNFTAPPIEAAE